MGKRGIMSDRLNRNECFSKLYLQVKKKVTNSISNTHGRRDKT